MYQYHVANNLCRLCTKHKISIEELAERIGKSPRQISRYRSGQCQNITLATLEKIADVFHVSAAELLDERY